ncbi:hypothetical protein RJ640_015843 [Escallonia rubra]|uniref:Uncharacterized protein n=1 Tax=Escallonia rubra TaxID=112253 RepID=A0AA88RA64_9ASTE|nr:hypothetical protein RJ640_015843 [Escallonia rubra]
MAEVATSSDITGEHETVNIEARPNNPITEEWKAILRGMNSVTSTPSRESKRGMMQKVPQIMRIQNQQEYDPMVVSLGPYHHSKQELQLAEKFKPIALRLYVSYCLGSTTDDLYNKVLEVIGFARRSYIEGSTDAYSDEELALMMLLDACFILNVIHCVSLKLPYLQEQETRFPYYSLTPFTPSVDVEMDEERMTDVDRVVLIYHEHLGGLGWVNIFRDMFLLENQLPCEVLHVLLLFRFGSRETGDDMIKKFIDFIVYRQRIRKNEVLIFSSQRFHPPLHLLEIYRTSFLNRSHSQQHSGRWKDKCRLSESSYTHYTHSCRSVTELKAKGIRFRPSIGKSLTDIKFDSNTLFGQLELPPRIITSKAKAIFLNLIAYEMCPYTPNDFSVTSYFGFMKSLINHPNDVKELRSKHILLNKLDSDKDVANMYADISIPTVNNAIFEDVEESIQEHYNNKAKTWIAELISEYLSSPWTAIALLAAIFLLVLSFLQTYFTISKA